MLTELKTVYLKSHEEMTVARVSTPAPEWEERLVGFLEHKGEPWVSDLQVILSQQLAGLEVHFYVGMLAGAVVGTAMTTEATAPRVGMVGHVFTAPEHRRKGICMALMEALTTDFVSRGGQGMTLGTGHKGLAYHIYHSFGFRSVANTGRMIWEAQRGFLGDYFAAGPTSVRDIAWPDWALLDLLYTVQEGDYLRSVRLEQYRPAAYEAKFTGLRRLLGEPSAQSKILQKETGEVVGHATLLPDPRWQNSVLLLDVFVHPNYCQAGRALLKALEFPADRKIQAYAEAASQEKIALLNDRGLEEEAILRNQLVVGAQPVDVVVLSTRS